MGELAEKMDRRQAQQLPLRAQQSERAERIGPPPGEARSSLGRQRFRKDQQPVKGVGQAQRRRDPERQARVDIAGEPAERGPEHEARAEGYARQSETGGTLLRRGDVGDVGIRGRNARRADAGNHPAHEQPPQVRRQRHQDVIEA